MNRKTLQICTQIFVSFFTLYGISTSLDARLYFLHIPKTGGTTIHTVLENQIHLNELYPPRKASMANIPVNHEFVSGHFPFWFCAQLDPEFDQAFKFTILRDPVERVLSLLRYTKKHRPNLRSMNLDEIFELLIHNESHKNDMTQNTISFLTSQPDLPEEDVLKNAKDTLNKLDFVVFLDNFEQDTKELFEALGIQWNTEFLPHTNTTEAEYVSPELLEKIKELNKLDIDLYEYAKKNKKTINSTYQFSSSSYKELLSKKNHIDYEFSMPLKGSGWCFRENVDRFSAEYPIYRWVMDKPATINFNLEKNYAYTMEFTAQPITPEIHPRVLINGVEIIAKRLDNKLFSRYHCEIPSNLISDQETEITFFSPCSFQYNALYPEHADNRKLSFAVDSIQIIPK
ncbi:MAG: sulfotransferase family protein [Rhabdochlamydiaceae bacterium]|nr:sulfotransferase family protein [Rhabdochlamydiaceae bacterium]